MEKPSLSYWAIAGLGLLWNLMGCLNYIMQTASMSRADLPEQYLAIFTQRPVWATAAFAVAVFAGAVGCILLILRRRVAVQLLGLSLVGSLFALAYMIMTLGLSVNALLSTGISILMACILLAIAMAARAQGWLR
ncbi:hypothetical protein [Pacificibacter sp. AS14]|uniref:hypothetical protein n=1 Tax=Pacificibacter sp. AS14 TaxID=3135785 RepID=UPI003182B2F6